MSTQQPPGGPEGYAQPQDPWGGYEPGVASVPTDPIPQQYDQYPPMGPGEVWSQATVAQGGPYGYAPQQPQPSSRGKLLGISLLALMLAGAAGYGAYWYLNQNTGTTGVSGTATPTPTTASPTVTVFDPHLASIGDCVFNKGTPESPDLTYVPCSTSKSYKIVKVATGPDIPEGPVGSFDTGVTSVSVCKDTTYQTWYGYKDAVTQTRDVFYCMTNNP
jgi:hypothetical protein